MKIFFKSREKLISLVFSFIIKVCGFEKTVKQYGAAGVATLTAFYQLYALLAESAKILKDRKVSAKEELGLSKKIIDCKNQLNKSLETIAKELSENAKRREQQEKQQNKL